VEGIAGTGAGKIINFFKILPIIGKNFTATDPNLHKEKGVSNLFPGAMGVFVRSIGEASVDMPFNLNKH
jgi:hypothetical protein